MGKNGIIFVKTKQKDGKEQKQGGEIRRRDRIVLTVQTGKQEDFARGEHT